MPNAPSPDAHGRLAIRTSRLVDVEAGSTLPDRTLMVADGRVEAVVADADGLPDGIPVVDLGGLTALPGLIDTRSHLVGEVQTSGVPATTTSAALAPGRFADLVAVEDHPLDDVTVLERPAVVVKGGRVALDRRVS